MQNPINNNQLHIEDPNLNGQINMNQNNDEIEDLFEYNLLPEEINE